MPSNTKRRRYDSTPSLNFTSMTSFFSLKRSARTRTRKSPTPCSSTSLSASPLDIIHEISHDDQHAFDNFLILDPSSRHPTWSLPLRRPKPRASSNISFVDFEIQKKGEARLSAYEFSIDDTLLMPPRSAPSPPTSPSPFCYLPPTSPAHVATLSGSPDSFRLTFSDNIYLSFPHPPRPSSQNSSPSSPDSDLPTTPTSSDDEFSFTISQSPTPSPSERRIRSKRASIKPLLINKSAHCLARQNTSSCPNANQQEKWEESESDSDYDALNDWYTEQFSDVLTLCSSPSPSSVTPPRTFPPARPDSLLSFSPLPVLSPPVSTGKSWDSKPLPEIPAVFFPSPQLDPTFPRRKRAICATRPLPLPPTSPGARPPPSSSVPLDMQVDEVDLLSQPSPSIYSQTDEVEDIELNMDWDMPLRLPLSLPTTPIDLEPEFARLGGHTRLSVIPESSEPATPPRSYRYDSELQTQQVQEMDRILRSRWSTSTLSSIDREPPSSTSSRLQFLFGSKKGKGHAKASSLSTPSKEINCHYPEYERTVRRSASRSSASTNSSASSGGSTLSGGLRRKPIPLALLINN